jgi:TPR repeat protein
MVWRLDGSPPRERVEHLRWLMMLVMVAIAGMSAHGQTGSPVLKKNRPPPPPPIVTPADNEYRIWTTFDLTRKANSGDPVAQHALGLRYLFGQGAAADTERAAYWIMKAAKQNYVPACFNYGVLSYHGIGVEWNPFEAYEQFRTCAQRGMVEAEYAMVQFLTENLVVPRDYQAAYAWDKLAADSGYAPAKAALVRFEKLGYGRTHTDSLRPHKNALPNTGLVFLDFPADTLAETNDTLLIREVLRSADPSLRKALGISNVPATGGQWEDSSMFSALNRAAEAGSPEALTVLGRSAEKGTGVPKDPVRASAYYVRAILLDSPRAPELLVNLMQHEGVLKEVRLRAEQGDSEAQFAWAGMAALGFDALLVQGQAYLTGDEAIRLLKKGAEKPYTPALVELGLCYYSGKWVQENRATALQLWKKAGSLGSKDAQTRLALVTLRSGNDSTEIRNALAVLQAAVEEGSVLGEMGLGYAYESGIGVAPQKALAAFYYREASVRGSQDAFRALRRMHDAIRPRLAEFQMND